MFHSWLQHCSTVCSNELNEYLHFFLMGWFFGCAKSGAKLSTQASTTKQTRFAKVLITGILRDNELQGLSNFQSLRIHRVHFGHWSIESSCARFLCNDHHDLNFTFLPDSLRPMIAWTKQLSSSVFKALLAGKNIFRCPAHTQCVSNVCKHMFTDEEKIANISIALWQFVCWTFAVERVCVEIHIR